MNRRHFIAASGAAVAGSALAADTAETPVIPNGVPLKQEPLPYAPEALQPHIDAETMNIHYGKHHAAYLTNLIKALDEAKMKVADTASLIKDIGSLPTDLQPAVRNQGGGHVNHTLFWRWMRPADQGTKAPDGKLAEALQSTFGSIDDFKKEFEKAAMTRFGSGWAWLIYKDDGKLAVVSTPNQDNPMMKGIVPDKDFGRPLFGLDVWEHAYYLKYKNKRQDYVTAWWNVVNWDRAARNYALVSKA